MPAEVAILHGWSDTSKSFHELRDFLAANGFPATQIWLGDYISKDDDVRVEDVAKRMDAVIQTELAANRLTTPFDLVVHSTGGLVVREWISRFYPDGTRCPAKRIVMLAPANFGSSLAHLGKSMIGRLTKGWNNWFQTGAEMLRGLELSSPYQWELARRDILDSTTTSPSTGPYGPDKVWPFLIVGARGYPSGLRQIVNEKGSDGVVRTSSANMNAIGMTIDFSSGPEQSEPRIWGRRCGPIPFAALPDRDHSSITDPGAESGSQPAMSSRLGRIILQALSCNSAQTYAQINEEWAAISDETADLARNETALRAAFQKNPPEPAELHQYFQIITRVRDDHGHPVDDYFIEFFAPQERNNQEAIYFHKEVLEDVHVNGQTPSFRAFFADRNDLMENYYPLIARPERRQVALSISAAAVGHNIRYFDSTKEGASGHFVVHRESHEQRADLSARLFRNATHLIEIVIPRQPISKVFKLAR